MNLLTSCTAPLYGSSKRIKVVFTPEYDFFFSLMYSRGISTCDAFAMRPRTGRPLHKVKEEEITTLEAAISTVHTSYNGWQNRETWLVNLWLSESMGSYEFLQEICEKDCEAWEKAEELEAHFQDQLEDMYDVPSFWSDILGTALDRVNWVEIVTSNQ